MNPTQLSEYLSEVLKHNLQLSLMIWGAPGIGKSSIVAQATLRAGVEFIDVRLSQLAPTDLRGTGIHAALSDELLRGLLLAGMLRGRTRMRGSAMSLLRRTVQPQWVRLAEDFLAEQLLAASSPDREVAAVMAACGGGVED